MPRNFDGRLPRQPESPLHNLWHRRYADTQCVGNGAWELLLEALKPWFSSEGLLTARANPAPIEDALMEFLASLRPLRNRRRPRRLYVAYRQADILDAKRIASLGNTSGMAFWLDAHDELRFLPGMEANPLQEVLSVAAMEMGLLNASHVVIVHSPGPEGVSGYLLGRAREHAALVRSTALWSDEPLDWARRASLVPMLDSERALGRWLDGLPPQAGRGESRVLRAALTRRGGQEPAPTLQAAGT
ncbi:hypothetical protein [Pseudomarimonas salicorniae]|uniref:Uncharacterized protein n=1 Tax=Pseudomarimonas salicorniae TaxID=2933270 RepID=A0ABT0GD72_9GAMM|nr:hypothetical protein [Lysobacter sp. CAU 1642]MCK7592494.1 hypothetical protein [Lysobacter sp. CAU 1642]